MVPELQVEFRIVLYKFNGREYEHHDQINNYKLLKFQAINGEYTFLQGFVWSCKKGRWKPRWCDNGWLKRDAPKAIIIIR